MTLTRLVAMTLDIFARRLLGSRGVSRHRRVVYSALVLVPCAASAFATLLFHRAIGSTGGATGIFLPVLTLGAFLVSGPPLLAAEGARDKSGAWEGVLGAMPLRRSEALLLTWSPLMIVAGALECLIVPPLVGGFTASGLAVGQSVVLACAVVGLGFGAAALSLAATYAVLRQARWTALRTPTTMLVWIVVCAVELWASIASVLDSAPRLGGLLLPRFVYAVAMGIQVPPLVPVASVIVLILSIVALGAAFATQRPDEPVRVRITWGSGRFGRSPMVAEAVYAMRSPSLSGNLAACLVLNLALAVVFQRLGGAARGVLVVPLAVAVVISAGVGARLPRVLHPARRTFAQVIGMPLDGWVARQTALGFFFFAVCAAPVLVMWSAATWSQRTVIAVMFLGSLAISHLVCWLVVVPLDNAIGQIVTGLVNVAAGGLLYAVLGKLDAPATGAVALALLVSSLVVAHRSEARRWRYSTDVRSAAAALTVARYEAVHQ